MDKRYQVFVSSTFADLKDERERVIRTLMEMDCIPAGMELFPAADEEQWRFIQRIIHDCDYYLLIIGGRYGSIAAEGVSYTEKEFDYALTKGLKVIALVHGAPDEIPAGKSDLDPLLREKLLAFKEKVKSGRLVRFWEKAAELPGLVSLSLTKTIKTYPAVGWVRANRITSEESLAELNQVRKEKEQLQEELRALRGKFRQIECTSDFGSVFKIKVGYNVLEGTKWVMRTFEIEQSWAQIFSIIAPLLDLHPEEHVLLRKLSQELRAVLKTRETHIFLDDQDFKTIGIRLTGYGLVEIKVLKGSMGGTGVYWFLTPKGKELMDLTHVTRAVLVLDSPR